MSFVFNRIYSVNIKSSLSAPFDHTHGVLQGSVLGPILFILYILHINLIFKRYIIYSLSPLSQQTIYSELFRTIGTIENFLELFGTLVLNNYNGNFFRTFENFSSNNILY